MDGIIEDYLKLTIKSIKREMFRPRDVTTGVYSWTRNGIQYASVGVGVDLRGVPVLYLSFIHDGDNVEQTIRLMFKHSNLNPEADFGYYYFVCPVTGKCCRNLYLVNGRFVSRFAFRPMYRKQVMSKRERGNYALVDYTLKAEELERTGTRRKSYYRGNPTPYKTRLDAYRAKQFALFR